MDSGDGDTGVAGTVIERSEPATVETDEAAPPPLIVRPDPTEPEPEAPVVVVEPEPEVAQAPQPAPAPPVGLVRDETDTDTDPAPQPRQNTDDDTDPRPEPREPRPEPEPEPEPTREPKPEPKPEPEPEPEPTENPQQYALKEGPGHSIHTAQSSTDPDDGSFYWEFLRTERHGNPGRPRSSSARLVAQLTNDSVDATADEFRCAAWLDAGDMRLTTDEEHFFTVTLVELDENFQPTGNTQQVIHQQTYNLRAGRSTRSEPMLNEPFPVDPSSGLHYTCEAEYIEK